MSLVRLNSHRVNGTHPKRLWPPVMKAANTLPPLNISFEGVNDISVSSIDVSVRMNSNQILRAGSQDFCRMRLKSQDVDLCRSTAL